MQQAHVLVVDDDHHTRLILATHIRRMGCEVSEAQNGQEALDILTGAGGPAHIDLIITDVWMPGMSGIDLLKAVHEIQPDMPIAMISARATLNSSLEAINWGAFAYLTKPFKADEVQKVVARGLQKMEEAKVRRDIARYSDKLAALESRLEALHAAQLPAAPYSGHNDDMLTSLIIGLRHELGNMATAIKLNLEVIKERQNIPPDLRENLDDLQASADDLISLLQRFKEYPQPGKIDQLIDLREVVISAVDAARNRDSLGKVRIDVNIRENNICVHGAAPELSRAILHLIENAVEASGQTRGRVQVSLASQNTNAVLSIEDDGPGFTDEQIEQAFSPSYTTKVEEGFVRGLGLGLFITRMVITLHGGQIRLENRPGGGARVLIHLPVTQANTPAA